MGVEPIVTLTADNLSQYQSFADIVKSKDIAHAKKGVLSSTNRSNSTVQTVLASKKDDTFVFEVKIDFTKEAEAFDPDFNKDRSLYRVWDDKNHNGIVDEGDQISIRDKDLNPYNDLEVDETKNAFNQMATFLKDPAKAQKRPKPDYSKAEKSLETVLTRQQAKSGLTSKDISKMSHIMAEKGASIDYQGKLKDGRVFVVALDSQYKGVAFIGTPGSMKSYEIESGDRRRDGGTTNLELAKNKGSFYFPSPEREKKGETPAFNGEPLTEFE
jgi:hypothetical protein